MLLFFRKEGLAFLPSIHLSATDTGSGPPVCLLHGLFGRAQNLGTLARRLAGRHRVLSLDLRNHGASPHAPGMGYADMAADVLHALRGMAAYPCSMLGHSMGGKVAMAAVLAAPDAVTRLAVADIAPVAYRHGNAGVAAALQALPLTPGLDRRSADDALASAVPDATVRGFLLQNLAFGAAPAWKIGLAEIAACIVDIEGWPDAFAVSRYDGPTLFVTGGRSDYVAPDGLQAIGRLFPRARVITLADAGHWVHADQPVLFAEAIEAFLDAVEVAACPNAITTDQSPPEWKTARDAAENQALP